MDSNNRQLATETLQLAFDLCLEDYRSGPNFSQLIPPSHKNNLSPKETTTLFSYLYLPFHGRNPKGTIKL